MSKTNRSGRWSIALILTVAAACSPDTSDQTASTLPPDDREGLAAIFDPMLADTGLHVTRAALVDPTSAADDASKRGRHLALYVEPGDAHDASAFAETVVSSIAAVAPFVFDEWAGVVSMDLCQEPPPGVDDREVPNPVTTVTVTRAGAASVAWNVLDIDGLVAAATAGGLDLFVDQEVSAVPAFAAAVAAAG